MTIEESILRFVENSRAVFIADIAREFHLSQAGAADIVKILEQSGKLSVIDKGIAKIVQRREE